jgi:hypothetical protein
VLDLDQVRATENAAGIRYPPALWKVAEDLVPVFAAASPGGRAATPDDLAMSRRLGLPESLVPFACEPQPEHTDYYCCELGGGPTVAVFAAHAVVAEWPTFADFLAWARCAAKKRE